MKSSNRRGVFSWPFFAFAFLLGCTQTHEVPSSKSANNANKSAVFDWLKYEGQDPVHLQPIDVANEYRNPVLSGFYPDPSITQVGSDYYLVNSTFTYFPGIPVFHSQDLVNWTQIGNVIDRPGMLDFDGLGLSRGVFAPTIEYHDGTFYVANTCVDCGGNFIVTAKDPAGPWSDPIWLPEVGGIDPSLFFDKDGTVYIMNNDAPPEAPLYEGHRAIWIRAVDPVTFQSISEPKVIINGGVRPEEKPIWIEGPHIYLKDGWYYLSAAEGGTAVNHSQVILRSKNVQGPYEAYEGNPIMTHRHLDPERDNPITSIGHADYVQDNSGQWWATFLGVRPYEGDYYNTGRETFLAPVWWENGWPIIIQGEERIQYVMQKPDLPEGSSPTVPMSGNFEFTENFEGENLPLHWVTPRVPKTSWYRVENGKLIIDYTSQGLGTMRQPTMLARRQQHLNATASVKIDSLPASSAAESGVTIFQSDDYFYALGASLTDEGRIQLTLRKKAGAADEVNGITITSNLLPETTALPLYLKIEAKEDIYNFYYSSDLDNWETVAVEQDGKILSTRVAGGFVGAVFGLYVQDPSAIK